ncbi:hypothetical protein [Coleofasciculus sp.]
MTQEHLDGLLEQILNKYQQAFAERISPEESTEEDALMLTKVFALFTSS